MKDELKKGGSQRRSKRQTGVGQVWNESRNVSENKRDFRT
jgi:hypothetical protein